MRLNTKTARGPGQNEVVQNEQTKFNPAKRRKKAELTANNKTTKEPNKFNK
jgi:hypothetical protein